VIDTVYNRLRLHKRSDTICFLILLVKFKLCINIYITKIYITSFFDTEHFSFKIWHGRRAAKKFAGSETTIVTICSLKILFTNYKKLSFAWRVINLCGISLHVIKYMRGGNVFRFPCEGASTPKNIT